MEKSEVRAENRCTGLRAAPWHRCQWALHQEQPQAGAQHQQSPSTQGWPQRSRKHDTVHPQPRSHPGVEAKLMMQDEILGRHLTGCSLWCKAFHICTAPPHTDGSVCLRGPGPRHPECLTHWARLLLGAGIQKVPAWATGRREPRPQ